MLSVGLKAVALTLLLGSRANASPNTPTASACRQIAKALGEGVFFPDDTDYSELSTINWSQTAWAQPACIVSPSNASEVSKVVKIAVAQKARFAIRSGGHSANPGYANINDGILISLDRLTKTVFDPSTSLVSIGPGNRWGEVYEHLEQFNRTMVGGRVPTVGVGGLTLGSGLSYLTDLHGLACDNVVSYEVVLSNGSIVEASATSNKDLFWGLKGGINNFGVVTEFKSRTYVLDRVWGSVSLYNASQMPEVLQAVNKYQSAPNKDLYANMHMNLAPINDSIVLTLVYLKPEPQPKAFAPFYALKPLMAQDGIMTLSQLQSLFSPGGSPRWALHVTGFKPSSAIYKKIDGIFRTAPELDDLRGITGGMMVGTVQPITANVALAGQSLGGNALGLQAVNQTWLGLSAAWWSKDDDAAAERALAAFSKRIEAAIPKNMKVPYLFMNDAGPKQEVIKSYGTDNVKRLQQVRAKYDASLVFHQLVPGGQKIPL
ncbi:hypothetical protein FGSG_10611 [Fusarium graminearum PH-1]|uniref:Chromosome 1, complete genome n=3 Tax=Fusarium sambucinum species complex TaxID=569360 RepID=I1S1K4_GIBZE|nr:hypothetical protein FGSG_10611 [Fusarium graminearum PH-1]ESU17354.1 hypothetical protein FGSG_10611 [Fusarium graminearum PH-1]PCD21670.1 hypothetical protein FGRA07_11572 [Fusarium graminearum]CAG1980631.1 unnamed protein product [Fusarium graminearum]CEF76066.1 unnamed protein product [Fusarium graminearum]|eukprot:XP_011319616.1 hypothetical protein FGSG_10611 [Fusarium graminearum PH-1]